VTNGTRSLYGIDGRTRWARRLQALIEAFQSDLGGADHLSEADKALTRAAASLVVKSEMLQADIINGRNGHADAAIRLASEARRCLGRVQARERPKAAPQSLEDYLAAKAAKREVAA
jgi:hypothetical protein